MFDDPHQDERPPERDHPGFIYGLIIVVIAAVIVAAFVVGATS